MPNFSHALSNAALAGVVGDANNIGATLYVGLSEDEPSYAAGAFSGGTEPTGNGYARVAIPNDDTNWSIADGEAVNLLDVEFPEATGNWDVDVSYAVIYSASSGGTILAQGPLGDAPHTIVLGNTPVFEPDYLKLSIA